MAKPESNTTHRHRKPLKKDFERKCIQRFARTADNIWKFWFTDGSSFAIQAEATGNGLPYMELCDVCIR